MFASLEVLHKYELPLRDVPCNRNKLAETITETFHDAFVARWGGECMSPSELLNFIFNLFAGFICEKLAKSELGYLNIKMDRIMFFSKEKSKQYSIHFLLSSIPVTCLILFSGIHIVINVIGKL